MWQVRDMLRADRRCMWQVRDMLTGARHELYVAGARHATSRPPLLIDAASVKGGKGPRRQVSHRRRRCRRAACNLKWVSLPSSPPLPPSLPPLLSLPPSLPLTSGRCGRCLVLWFGDQVDTQRSERRLQDRRHRQAPRGTPPTTKTDGEVEAQVRP